MSKLEVDSCMSLGGSMRSTECHSREISISYSPFNVYSLNDTAAGVIRFRSSKTFFSKILVAFYFSHPRCQAVRCM